MEVKLKTKVKTQAFQNRCLPYCNCFMLEARWNNKNIATIAHTRTSAWLQTNKKLVHSFTVNRNFINSYVILYTRYNIYKNICIISNDSETPQIRGTEQVRELWCPSITFKAMHCPLEAISFAKMDWWLAKNSKLFFFPQIRQGIVQPSQLYYL